MYDAVTQVEEDRMWVFTDSTSVWHTSQVQEPPRFNVHSVLRKPLRFYSYKLLLLHVMLYAYCNAKETFKLENFDRCELLYE